MNSTVRFTKKRKEPTSPSPEQKKSVSFLPSVLVYRTMHINNFTDEEIDNSWYSAEEMQTIVDDCVSTISSMDKMGPAEPSQCIRGLEFRTPKSLKRRAHHRFCSFDSVLEEQEAQWESRENDVSRIRSRYSVYSKPSRAEALRMGLEDAKEAMMIYREGETCSLVSSAPTKTQTTVFPKTGMKLQARKYPVTSQTPVNNTPSLSLRQYHSPTTRAY